MMSLIHSTKISPGPGIFNAWAIEQQRLQSEPICSLLLTHALVKIFFQKTETCLHFSGLQKREVKICRNYRPLSIAPKFATLFKRIHLNQVN